MTKKNSTVSAIIIAVVLIIFSIFSSVSAKKKAEKCTMPVTAEITRIDKETTKKTSSSNNKKKTTYQTKYKPYFSYEVDGKTYTGHASAVTSSKKYKIGNDIKIKVDPDKPSSYLVASESSGSKGSFSTIVCAVILIAAALMPKKRNP